MMWEIVGGADKGGILVREGRELTSKQAPSRLSTGATVEELELVGERLRYRRVTGSGPDTGWVSIALQGKVLAQKLGAQKLDITVFLDRDLGISTKLQVEKGSTCLELKRRLAA